ncbi:uncharacterized protein BBOV_IV004420 [Babesia bovis T2Bo]|uniref:RRM domain-containing protein n=1 Tax=Babesia bovis TaxID=5865 RepID=A7AQI4_BABBO|nr:uncharacterized protein BBOV_IV004420 [Babesia bovis T2Bo]EDO06803.1 hypothetical protein BBOV_IV004420 [Babesia bovis T2Bo]|eukprot:XP_001610371.1 hypothetical protein [Babesia bovis T2Bo]
MRLGLRRNTRAYALSTIVDIPADSDESIQSQTVDHGFNKGGDGHLEGQYNDPRPRKTPGHKSNETIHPKTKSVYDIIDEPIDMEKIKKTGVIFISRIPPFMSIKKIRSYFSKFGQVGKIYAEPETLANYKKRVKLGGNTKLKFEHGWVEFLDKKDAKLVAMHLNGQPVGEKKRHNVWRDDLWNIKYLPKYKFSDVMDYLHQERRERKDKLSYRLAEARKENYNYREQLEAEKEHKRIEMNLKRKGIESYTHKVSFTPKESKHDKDSEESVPVSLLSAIVS